MTNIQQNSEQNTNISKPRNNKDMDLSVRNTENNPTNIEVLRQGQRRNDNQGPQENNENFYNNNLYYKLIFHNEIRIRKKQ